MEETTIKRKPMSDNERRVVDKYLLSEICEDEFPLRAYYMIEEKRYYCGFNSVAELVNTMKESENNQWHEILRNKGKEWQKFVVDIDCAAEELDGMPFSFQEYIEEVIMEMKILFYGLGMHTEISVKNGDSSREDKYSRHLICSGLVVRGEHVKCFGRALKSYVHDKLKYEYELTDKLLEMADNWIDLSIYNKNHSLRVHLSAKKGAGAFIMLGGDNSAFDVNTLISVCDTGSIEIECNPLMCTENKCALGNENNRARIYNSGANELTALNGIEPILSGLKTKRYSEYDSWVKMGMALYNSCGGGDIGLKLWDSYSKSRNPKKYTAGACASKYKTFAGRANCNGTGDCNSALTLGTILHWAKEDCAEKLIEYRRAHAVDAAGGNSKRRNKFNVYKFHISAANNIRNFVLGMINADEVTEQRYVAAELDAHPLYALKSPMDTGKSTLVLSYIEKMIAAKPDFTCILLQFRTSLSDDVVKKTEKLDFTDYRTISGEIDLVDDPRLIIQIESLHRLVYHHIDLLVIDEVESVNSQLFAGLNAREDNNIQLTFQNIIKDASQLIIMDGLLRNKTVSAYEKFLNAKFYVHVNRPPIVHKKVQVMVGENQWKNAIVADLCVGRKIYVVSAKGKNFIEKLQKYIQDECAARGAKIAALSIYGGKDNSAATSDFSGELVKYDLVIASPAVSAGVDFNVAGYFYKVYSFVTSQKVGADSQLQSLKRVRKPICTDICMLVQYCSKKPLPLSEADIIEAAESKIWYNTVEGIKWPVGVAMGRDKRGNCYFANKEDKWFNFFLSVQAVINGQMFDVLSNIVVRMEEEGYEFEIVPEVIDAKSAKLSGEISKLIISKNNKEIANAPEISAGLAIQLTDKKHLTDEESASLSKYNLRLIYGWGGAVTEEFVKKYRAEKVNRMFNMCAVRDIPLNILAKNAEERIATLSDIEKTKLRECTDRHKAIRDLIAFVRSLENADGKIIHDSKKGGALDELRKYINTAVESGHSAYRDKNKQENNDQVCRIINVYLEEYGAELSLIERRGKTRTERVYELTDITKEYFTFDQNDKNLPYIG